MFITTADFATLLKPHLSSMRMDKVKSEDDRLLEELAKVKVKHIKLVSDTGVQREYEWVNKV